MSDSHATGNQFTIQQSFLSFLAFISITMLLWKYVHQFACKFIIECEFHVHIITLCICLLYCMRAKCAHSINEMRFANRMHCVVLCVAVLFHFYKYGHCVRYSVLLFLQFLILTVLANNCLCRVQCCVHLFSIRFFFKFVSTL